MQEQISDYETPNMISVHRDDVWGMALIGFGWKRFRPDAPLRIDFFNYGESAEGAIDEGGPTKELFTLCLTGMMSGRCFIGTEQKLLTRDKQSPCMKDAKHSKNYPMSLSTDTHTDKDLYLVYQRRGPAMEDTRLISVLGTVKPIPWLSCL